MLVNKKRVDLQAISFFEILCMKCFFYREVFRSREGYFDFAIFLYEPTMLLHVTVKVTVSFQVCNYAILDKEYNLELEIHRICRSH